MQKNVNNLLSGARPREYQETMHTLLMFYLLHVDCDHNHRDKAIFHTKMIIEFFEDLHTSLPPLPATNSDLSPGSAV